MYFWGIQYFSVGWVLILRGGVGMVIYFSWAGGVRIIAGNFFEKWWRRRYCGLLSVSFHIIFEFFSYWVCIYIIVLINQSPSQLQIINAKYRNTMRSQQELLFFLPDIILLTFFGDRNIDIALMFFNLIRFQFDKSQ